MLYRPDSVQKIQKEYHDWIEEKTRLTDKQIWTIISNAKRAGKDQAGETWRIWKGLIENGDTSFKKGAEWQLEIEIVNMIKNTWHPKVWCTRIVESFLTY